MRRAPFLIALVSALVLTACGGGDDGGSEEAAAVPGGADPEAVEVIRDWSDTLRDGDVEGAADFFGLPTVAQNGTPPFALETREEVISFNEALPCGAELIEARTDGRLTIATFELTERPGPGTCGPGVGETARTVFRVQDGKIFEWRRATDEDLEAPTDEPVV